VKNILTILFSFCKDIFSIQKTNFNLEQMRRNIMANAIAELGKNLKTNFTDAIAAGANPADCFDKVISVAGLDDAGFQALAFSLPLDKWMASINAAYKEKAAVWAAVLLRLAAIDKKIDVAISGPFSKAKTIGDSMAVAREMLRTGDKTAVPEHLEARSLSTGAMVGIGVGVLAVLGVGYHFMKKD